MLVGLSALVQHVFDILSQNTCGNVLQPHFGTYLLLSLLEGWEAIGRRGDRLNYASWQTAYEFVGMLRMMIKYRLSVLEQDVPKEWRLYGAFECHAQICYEFKLCFVIISNIPMNSHGLFVPSCQFVFCHQHRWHVRMQSVCDPISCLNVLANMSRHVVVY